VARLVCISNRVADPRKTEAGGLAVALSGALQANGGMWFGWSGKILPEDGATPAETPVHQQQAGNVTLATLDLSQWDHDAYYLGYSNAVLWPVFHYRLDLADFDAGYIGGYRRVNQLFAAKLMPLLKEDDIVWVHDYHLIPLASELRALGCRNKIGFFLHIPLPPPQIFTAIPRTTGWPGPCSPTTSWASRAKPTWSTSTATHPPKRAPRTAMATAAAGAPSAARCAPPPSRSASTWRSSMR
jgi:trehalose 6-phosphate synthase